MRSTLAIALVLALAGCRRKQAEPPPPPTPAALVNGQAIPVPAVQRELDRLRRGTHQGEPAAPDARDAATLGRAVLGTLVDRTLLLQRAREAGLSVSDADVQRELEQRAEAWQNAGHSFEDQLRQEGLTADALMAEARDRLLAERFVVHKLGVPAVPANEDVKAFYEAHRADYEKPEMVRALQIVVSSAEEAKSLLDQIRAGASFEELARKHSESPDGKRGGDLGYFARGTMPKIFDETCFALRVNQTSGVVASPYGYHLFKVTDRRPAHKRTLDEARAEIERRIVAEHIAAGERKLLDELRATAKVQLNEAQLSALR
jgi:parvulin-like peptidyl-prolyl isomerase